MTALRHTDKLRRLIPQAARERLYGLSPGRAGRWRRWPGIERVPPGLATLTFDDGPDEDATVSVLEALDTAGVRATFFMLGSQLETHVDLGREVLRRGHEVGLHGQGHERHDRIDATSSRGDILRGYKAIEDALGIQCRWYRPPYGKMSDAAFEACRDLGLKVVYWSAWGLDWEPVTSGRIADVASTQLDDGGILLLHDSARYARRSTARTTADAIPAITHRAAELGLRLVTLGAALPYNNETERDATTEANPSSR